MLHPIQQRLRPVATQARRIMIASAVTMLAAAVLASGLVVGWIDFVFRIQDRGVRLSLSLAVLAGVVFVGWRYVLPACRRRFEELEIALHLERHFPELEDRLSSSVEFLGQRDDDPVAGSPALRHAVIHRAQDALNRVPVEDVIRVTPAVRSALICGTLLVVVLLHAWWKPALVWIAASRLMMPWAGAAWPRIHHLEFESPPAQLIAGNDLELTVVDRSGTFPSGVFLDYVFDGDRRGQLQHSEMIYRGGKMVARLPSVEKSLRFRARGGDHQEMPWSRIEVLAAPVLGDLRVVLRPPAYSGRPAVEVTRQFQALEGTQVEISGTASKPLARAQLRLSLPERKSLNKGESPLASGRETAAKPQNAGGESTFFSSVQRDAVIDLQVGSDGRQFTSGPSAWVVSTSGTYAVVLTDRGGLANSTDSWEFACIPDQPPRPALSLRGNLPFVTPRSTLSLMVSAEDDWGIESLVMQFGSTTSSTAAEMSNERADQMELVADGNALSGAGISWTSQTRTKLSGEFSWRIANWVPQEPPTVLQMMLVARDGRPHTVRTPILSLPVVTDAEMKDWLEGQQRPLLENLTTVLAIQNAVYDTTRTSRKQTAEQEAFEPGLAQRLQVAEAQQRQVRVRLLTGADAVNAQVALLLADLDASGITLPELRLRLTTWQARLAAVGRDHLPLLEQVLAGAVKELPREAAAWSDVRADFAKRLEMATETQQRVIEELEAFAAALSQWQALEDVVHEIREILREQAALESRVRGWRNRAIVETESTSDTESDAVAGSLRQLQLAAAIDRALNALDAIYERSREHRPESTEPVAAALAFSRTAALQALMRQAAVRIRQQQWGEALQHYDQIQSDLATLLRTLAGRRDGGQHLTYQQLQRLRGTLKSMLARQQALVQRVEQLVRSREDAAAVAEPSDIREMAAQQQALAGELETVAAGLEATKVTQWILKQGAAAMSEAARRISAGLLDDELRQSQATAVTRLELMLQALQMRPENSVSGVGEAGGEPGTDAQSSAAQWNLVTELKLLKLMQQEVLRQTERVHAAGRRAGGLSDFQRRDLRSLSEQQGVLANLLQSLPSWSDAPATLPADENPRE